MSYVLHNFQPKQVLPAAALNEMDAQIALNAEGMNQSLRFTEQTLTDEEQAQCRENIAAVKISDSGLGIVIEG